jgi:hypothetical protein
MISSEPRWTVSPNTSAQINSVAIDAKGEFCIFGTSSEFDKGRFAVYCYNAKGEACWHQEISSETSYQGVFWVAISQDGEYAAAGGEFTKNEGFLKAYAVTTGELLLDVTVTARVNQVSLSLDGQLLLAVFADTVHLYQLVDGQYQLSSSETLVGYSCNSCALASHGQKAVVSAIQYNETGTAGKVASFQITDNKLLPLSSCHLSLGSMRVAITDNGQYWGASLHDGSCVAFDSDHIESPLWSCKPNITGLDLAYGFDITQTSEGTVLVAVGANKTGRKQGYVYLVESHNTGGQILWGAELTYSANPGISLDRDGRYVTATDGAPMADNQQDSQESAGYFYLFDASSGTLEWQYATSLMNWPMMINQAGDKILGASDNGYAYFWENNG